jgi:SnoaL-like domain
MPFSFLPPADELQIRNLIARYALCTDAGEADEFANLYVIDGTWTRENSPPAALGGSGLPRQTFRGREALAELIVTSAINRFQRKARHQMTDVLIEPGTSANEAKIVFRALVTNWMDGPGKIAMSVHYRGTCVLTNEGWRFKDVSARVLPE